MIDVDWFELVASDELKSFGVPFLTTFLMIIVKMVSRDNSRERGFIKKYMKRGNFNFGLQLTVTSFSIYLIGSLVRIRSLVLSGAAPKSMFNDITNTFTTIGLLILVIISLSFIVRFLGWESKNRESQPTLFYEVILPNLIGIYSLSAVINTLN